MTRFTLVLLSALALPTGCAHAAPSWVGGGSRSEPEGSGRVVYGVGTAPGPITSPRARATAANRARNEVVRVLQPGRRFNAAVLSGIEIADYYTDRDGTVYALAVYRNGVPAGAAWQANRK